MKKEETLEEKGKRQIREEKELSRLNKAAQKPNTLTYFIVLMIVITVIYVADEITSNINSAMQPQIIFDIFNITSQDVNSDAYKSALSSMTFASFAVYLFYIITPFYKSLFDRFGRRPFLIINTICFGIGLFVIMIAKSLFVYILGYLIVAFVTPNDVQVMYIMESAPKKHRAKLCSIAKAIALVSCSLIGVMRKGFLDSSDLSSWRLVYIIPVCIALTIGVISFFLVRETPVYIEERSAYLKLTDDERLLLEKEKEEKKEASKGGVFKAFKFIFTHKQIRSITIAGMIFFLTIPYTMYYSTIMEGGMSTEEVSLAIIIFPFANGIITFFSGFLSDKIGRKKACFLFGILAVVFLALFIFSCNYDWGAVPSGIFYGVSIGGLWSLSDTLSITMASESVPTQIRASVNGVISLLLSITGVISVAIVVVLQKFFNIGWVCLAICVPFMVLALVYMIINVKETKDVDLDKVTGLEWDKNLD